MRAAAHAPANLSAPGPVLITIPDAAHLAKRPESTVRRWLADGRLKRYGTGKPWMVDYEALVALRDTLTVGRPKSERVA